MKTLTPEQTAEVLQLSVRTVYDYLRKGKLPGCKIGGRKWRVSEEELAIVIRARGSLVSRRQLASQSSEPLSPPGIGPHPEALLDEEYARRKREEILNWAKQHRRVQRKSALGLFADVEGLSSEDFARRKQEEIELENRCRRGSEG